MKKNTSYLHSVCFVVERKLLKPNSTNCLHLLPCLGFFVWVLFGFFKGMEFSATRITG